MDDRQVRELRTALKLLQRRLRRELRSSLGLSQTALRVLVALSRADGGTPGGLAAELQMTSSNVAAALRELEAGGHVRRSPDPEDGRRTRITLTAGGADAVEGIRTERETWLGRAIDDELDAAERELLVRAVPLLARLAARVDGDPGAAGSIREDGNW